MPQPLEIIEFFCTADTFGMPRPHIDDGTAVILFQNGVAEVLRYEAPRPPEEPSPLFDPPTNLQAPKPEALEVVLLAHPQLDSFKRGYMLLCPDSLASKAIWRTLAHPSPLTTCCSGPGPRVYF